MEPKKFRARGTRGTRVINGKYCVLCGRHTGPFALEQAQREREALLKTWEIVHVIKRDQFGWDYALYVFGERQ